MKKLMCVASAMMMVSGVIAQEAAATAKKPAEAPVAVEEKESSCPFSFEATMDLYSAYVWRGQVLNDHPVWQPGATAAFDLGEAGSISAGVWSSFDFTDDMGHTSGAGLNEIDYTLDYTVNVGGVDLSVGHIWYTFPRANGPDYGGSTREIYVGAAFENDIVTPSVKVYRDYVDIDGYYADLGLNKEFAINDQLTVGADLILGLCDKDYAVGYFSNAADGGFNNITADIYASYALTENLSVGAKIAWSSLIEGDARDAEAYEAEDILWGGINLSASF